MMGMGETISGGVRRGGRTGSGIWRTGEDLFSLSVRSGSDGEDDAEALKWAALEKLPTYDCISKGILNDTSDTGTTAQEVDVVKLRFAKRQLLFNRLLKVAEEDMN